MSESPEPPTNVTIHPALDKTRDAVVRSEESKSGRKREREGSLEPASQETDSAGVMSLTKKKNRVLDSSPPPPGSPIASHRADKPEGAREQALRKGVEDLGVGEGKAAVGGSSSSVEVDVVEGATDEMRAVTPTAGESATPPAPAAGDLNGGAILPSSGLVPSTDPDNVTPSGPTALANQLDDARTTISTAATIDSSEDLDLSDVATPIWGATPARTGTPLSAPPIQADDNGDGDDSHMTTPADAPEEEEEDLGAAVEKGLLKRKVEGELPLVRQASSGLVAATKKVKETESLASTASPSSAPLSASPSTGPKLSSASGFSSFASAGGASKDTLSPSSSSSTSNKPITNQPTFSAFSTASGASPFSAGTKHISSPSPFAGSNAFSSFATSPFKAAADAKPTASFGDILSSSGGNGDASGSSSSGSKKAGTADTETGEGTQDGVDVDGSDAAGAESEDASVEGGGVSSSSKIEAQDIRTGEEGEETRHQVRAKLHIMEKSGSWKERGTGLCKLNVNLSTGMPRLIMRAEGVFRLILNVALFAGMSCERQDKWVRLIAFENGSLVHLAIKVGTVKAAEDLFERIQELIPEDKNKPPPPPKSLNYAFKD